MFSVVLLLFTVITHKITNAHSVTHTMALGQLRHSQITLFLGWRRSVFGVWAWGLLVTFEQPFRLPRAEQAQGVLPRLNPQLKKAWPAISRPAFPKTNLTCSTASVLTEVSVSPQVQRP